MSGVAARSCSLACLVPVLSAVLLLLPRTAWAEDVDAGVLARASRLERPRNTDRCCCLDAFVTWVEVWATTCAASDSLNATTRPYEESTLACRSASCACLNYYKQRPVDEPEVPTCLERAASAGLLSNLAKGFVPFMIRKCWMEMQSLNDPCGKCDSVRASRGNCDEL
mmetsp:Transcript_77181/g.195956  ORF Transcript_77181/g.195956 Transcript_77181/m.195956 type:complete len:168 (+) Transcript_77181:133-636(+)